MYLTHQRDGVSNSSPVNAREFGCYDPGLGLESNYLHLLRGVFVYRLTKSTSSLETWPEPETNTFFGALARSLSYCGRPTLSRLPINRLIGIIGEAITQT